MLGERGQKEDSGKPTTTHSPVCQKRQYHIPWGTVEITVTIKALKDEGMVVPVKFLFKTYLVREMLFMMWRMTMDCAPLEQIVVADRSCYSRCGIFTRAMHMVDSC